LFEDDLARCHEGHPLMSTIDKIIMFTGNYSNKIIELKRISTVWDAKLFVVGCGSNSTVEPALSLQPLDDST